MITLHGSAASRASRSLLALEEIGLPYTHAPLKPWAEPADAERLADVRKDLGDGGENSMKARVGELLERLDALD